MREKQLYIWYILIQVIHSLDKRGVWKRMERGYGYMGRRQTGTNGRGRTDGEGYMDCFGVHLLIINLKF